MTRCISCDVSLDDVESTRKHQETGEYLDLCNRCLRSVLEIQDIPYESNFISMSNDPIIEDNNSSSSGCCGDIFDEIEEEENESLFNDELAFIRKYRNDDY